MADDFAQRVVQRAIEANARRAFEEINRKKREDPNWKPETRGHALKLIIWPIVILLAIVAAWFLLEQMI
jgi:hypothetical protein